MCEHIKRIKKQRLTGFKVCLKEISTGKHLSFTSFIEYKAGKIPNPTNTQVVKALDLDYMRVDEILTPDAFYYKEELIGRTAIFKYLTGAEALVASIMTGIEQNPDFKLVILKMDVICQYKGFFIFRPVYIGSKIKTIEELKIEE